MPYGNTYNLEMNATSVSAAISLLQWKCGAAGGALILRAWASQSSSTTSAQQRIQLRRKSAAATVTAAALGTNLFDVGATGVTPSASLGTAATGVNASVEGTDGDTVFEDSFNVLNGWEKIFIPEDRIFIPGAGIIALKFPVAPGSATTYEAGITVLELG